MQIDRLMLRQATRLAPKLIERGLGGLARRRAAAAAAPEAAAAPAAPRGSGSWANEWIGATAAVERARALARPGRSRKAAPPAAAAEAPIPEGSVRPRPLMTAREVKLHNWIADRLEAEAPDCSLHTGVALQSFLASDVPGALDGLVADMLIADEAGQPVCALVRDRRDDPARQLRLLDALLDADLPFVDLPDRLSLSTLWTEIARTLPR